MPCGRKVLTDFLGEAEVKAIMTDGYNAYNFLDGVLDHLICMAHARAKKERAYNQDGEEAAESSGLGTGPKVPLLPIRGSNMEEALGYLEHFWDGLFLYRKNGAYPIDNNLVERQVRSQAAKRMIILRYGNDNGARMASTYHGIISTVLLKGKSVWRFFGDFFIDPVTGADAHLSPQLGRNNQKTNRQQSRNTAAS